MIHRIDPEAATPAGQLRPAAGGCDGGPAVAEGPRSLPPLVLGRIFLEIGATAFGGLGPSLAIIERELVEKRRVVTAEEVAEAAAAARFLPGSALIQVVSFLGYRLGGWTGSALATTAYVLPSVTAMLLLALVYDAVSDLSAFGPAARGLTAAVVGLLLATTYRFGRAMVGGPVTVGIALAAFGATAGLGIPAAAVVVAAGLIGAPLLSAPAPGAERGRESRGGGRR